MAIRITGMNSGLDTESIITQLASARSVKVNSIKKAQIKQSWKTEAWASLNSKVMKFYNETLTDMQYASSYSKKASTVSDSTVATVLAASNAVVGNQTLSVSSLATAGYLTGAKLSKTGGGEINDYTKLKDLGVTEASRITIATGKDGKNSRTVEINGNMTVADFNTILSQAGVNSSIDSKQSRFYINSKSTGANADFTIIGADAAGMEALKSLGLNADSASTKEAYRRMYESTVSSIGTMSREEYMDSVIKESEREDYEFHGSIYDYYLGPDGVGFPKKPEPFTWKEPGDDLEKDSSDGKYHINDNVYDTLADAKADYEAKKEEYDHASVTYNVAKEAKDYVEPIRKRMEAAGATFDRLASSDFEAFYASATTNTDMKKIDGSDAKITLNGVEYTGSKNVFEINGLTITATGLTVDENGVDKPVTIKTDDDYSGTYDMVKNFLTKYNELINEMDKLYNAGAAKGYDPLLSEEKAELKDSEIEEWEKKVKDSLLRRDGTLYDVKSSLTSIMLKSFDVKGQKLSLSSFGVNTLGYFNAAENEKNAYHIYGDKDDATVSGKDDMLMKMITTDPEAVSGFFTSLAKNMRDTLFNKMKSTEFSSSFTLYEDKLMKSEYCDYTKRVTKAESALNDYIDKWYDKFAKMESALAKVNAKQTSMGGLFGGGA